MAKIPRFRFVRSEELGISLSAQMIKYQRSLLPKGIYWISPARKTLWNRELVRDLFIRCDGDRNDEKHQALVAAYLEEAKGEI